jgi:hypothetical protein
MKMNAVKGTIIAATIAGIATLGAAVVPMLSGNKEQAPSIQQNASGNGVNVGRDYTVNANTTKSAGEEAAERVQACEVQHGMKTSSDKTQSDETIPATTVEPEKFIEHVQFRSCTWPVSRYADGDGYLEIKVQTVNGPGEDQASGTNEADRITAPCKQLRVAYQFGHMGDYKNLDPVTISADTVETIEGRPFVNTQGALPFYPESGEFVMLHNGNNVIQSAKCI